MSLGRRIAIVVHAHYPGDPRIRRQSDALIDAGYEVDIFALRRPGEPPQEKDRVRIIRLPVNRAFVGLAGHLAEYVAFTGIAAWRLTREHRRRRYDLVQVATVPDFLAVATVPVKLGGVPLLLDLHEDMPAFFRDRFGARPMRSLLPLVTASTRGAARLADELITVHEPLRELAIERGVSPDRISVVMNSADPRLFDPERHPRRPFMADGTLRLIHHSNLQRLYGLDLAIEGLALVDRSVRWRLDVYGEGPWRPMIEDAIRRTKTASRIRLHGRVPMDDLPSALAAADVGLVPSRADPYLQLSLSTKLLEYAAMGVPTVATELATFRRHFTDAALRYVPGGDPSALARAIEALVADPRATVAMGAEARRQAAAYAWADQSRRYLEIVAKLVKRRTTVAGGH